MKNPIFILVIHVGFIHSTIGQGGDLILGAGFNAQGVRDKGYSPLLYDGIGYDFQAGFRYFKKNREVLWFGGFGQANLSNEFGRSMKTTTVSLINFTFYAPKDETRKYQWGWSNNNTFHTRQIDDFLNYNGRTDYFTAFGPAWKFEHALGLFGQDFSFETMAQIQLLGFYLPSSYVSSMPQGFGYENKSFFSALWSSTYLFFPGSAYNGGVYPTLKWKFSPNNSLSLMYRYEYSHFNKVHLSQRSVGIWLLSLTIKLY
jgi:hypothetical protein